MVHRLGKREQETSAGDRWANLSVLRGGVNSDTACRSAPSTAEFAGKLQMLVDAKRRFAPPEPAARPTAPPRRRVVHLILGTEAVPLPEHGNIPPWAG
jgi:hypothetical protein